MDNDFNWAGDDFNQLNEGSAELIRARREADTQFELYGYVLPYTAKRVIDLSRAVDDALDNAGEAEREAAWAGEGFNRRNKESAGVQLEFDFTKPACDMNMPHFFGEDGAVVECPPNCPGRR